MAAGLPEDGSFVCGGRRRSPASPHADADSAMGGVLELIAAPRRGSRSWLRCPRDPARPRPRAGPGPAQRSRPPPTPARELPLVQTRAGTKVHVLIVRRQRNQPQGDAAMCDLFDCLRRDPDGAEAWRLCFGAMALDIVSDDIDMPSMTGFRGPRA